MGRSDTPVLTRAISGTRRARHDCWASIVDLQNALDAPPTPSFSAWAAGVVDALFKLRGTFGEPLVVTEGPHGLYEEVMERTPRLAHNIAYLRDEFEAIRERLQDDLVVMADPSVTVATARHIIPELLGVLESHREKEAELIYQSYEVDIGAEG